MGETLADGNDAIALLGNTVATGAILVVIITIFSFQQFAPAYVMTRGGPSDSTLFVVYYLYQQAFSFLDPGYASAIAVVFLATVLVVALLQRRLLSRGNT